MKECAAAAHQIGEFGIRDSADEFDVRRGSASEMRLRWTVAGDDQVFHWAHAEIQGDKVIVWTEDVTDPVAVRYAWANNPNATLYNHEGLPASPFRTDDWTGLTTGKD